MSYKVAGHLGLDKPLSRSRASAILLGLPHSTPGLELVAQITKAVRAGAYGAKRLSSGTSCGSTATKGVLETRHRITRPPDLRPKHTS